MADCFGFVVKRHDGVNVNRHNDRRLVAIVAMRIVVHPVDIQVLMERSDSFGIPVLEVTAE
jgi:hypothetical protein